MDFGRMIKNSPICALDPREDAVRKNATKYALDVVSKNMLTEPVQVCL